MADQFEEKVNKFVDKAAKTIEKGGKNLFEKLDVEKQKAQIRSDIGHNSRDLTKAYEKLGRDFYAAQVTGIPMEDQTKTFDLIRAKEKLIELLNDKLDSLE